MKRAKGRWVWLWWINDWYYIQDWYRDFYLPALPAGYRAERAQCTEYERNRNRIARSAGHEWYSSAHAQIRTGNHFGDAASTQVVGARGRSKRMASRRQMMI